MTEVVAIIFAISILLNIILVPSSIPFVSKKRKRQITYDIAYSLVWDAERVWDADRVWEGKKLGKIKRAYVKAKLYIVLSTMPMFKSSIINENYIEQVIDEAVKTMQESRITLKNVK